MSIRIRSAITPLFACGLCLSSALAAETRIWTSADGTASFEGRLEAYVGNRGDCLTYLYDQSDNKWGIAKASGSGAFKAGRWHHVEYEIFLNEPGKSNGSAKVTIDGKTAVTQRGVKFRGKGGPETEIRNLLFNTFHGGHDPSWAPKDRKGAFATVHAWFDNFLVTEL